MAEGTPPTRRTPINRQISMKKSTEAARFFLSQDNSGHWYIVPCAIAKEWEKWCELPEDDEASWNPPKGALAVGGCPSRISFTDPKERE